MLHTAIPCWQPFLGLAVVLLLMGSTIGCPARCECSAQNKSVSCHRRRLLAIPEGIPIETKILDLSKNRLKSINPEEFISYPLLEEIDLSDNIIANVEPGAFNNLFNLRSLRLKGNRLKLVPLGVFTGLSNLTKLDISENKIVILLSINNNPLACDCRLLWLLQRQPNLQFGGQQPMCAGPDTIRERSFKDFHSTALSFYFTCKKPKIREKKLQHLLVDEGQTVQLECNADGDPQPVISWVTPRRRFITTKSNGRATVLGDGTLEIRFAQDQDSGMYVCIASNAAGNDTFTASLTVKGFTFLLPADKPENRSLEY